MEGVENFIFLELFFSRIALITRIFCCWQQRFFLVPIKPQAYNLLNFPNHPQRGLVLTRPFHGRLLGFGRLGRWFLRHFCLAFERYLFGVPVGSDVPYPTGAAWWTRRVRYINVYDRRKKWGQRLLTQPHLRGAPDRNRTCTSEDTRS